MKRIFTKFTLIGCCLAAVMLQSFSCSGPDLEDEGTDTEIPEEKPSTSVDLTASVVTAGTDFLEIKVVPTGLDAVAYQYFTSAQEGLQPASIFRSGEKLEMSGEIVFKLENLTGQTKYYFYFAGQKGTDFYEEVVELEAETKAYDTSGLLTLVEVGKRNYKVHVNVPENVEKDDTRSIRYAFSSVPMYLSNKMKGMHDADLLYQNGQVDTRKDITVDINPDNEYYTDENGNLIVDPETGEPYQMHEPNAPGEPVIFMAAEFEWGEGYIANWGPKGDGWGYFIPLCDLEGYYGDETAPAGSVMTRGLETDVRLYEEEEAGWYGAYQKMVFTLEQPDPLDAEFDIRYEEITPIDATIKVIPDDNVFLYCYCVVDDATYEGILSLLDGREEWLQWFVSSYWARFSFMIGYADGPITINVKEDFFVDWLHEQSNFHLLITALGDENGTTQKFIHQEFQTTAKVLDAPEIVVTAVEDNENVYEAKFNIKAPNGDLVEAYYGANYVRDWIPELNSGATYASLVQNPLSSEDVKAINSPEGLTISIPSLDGQTTRIAVLGYNKEYTPNILQKGCSAIADCSTRLQHLDPHIDSPLYKELVGDWTATATVYATSYVNNQQTSYKKTSKAKITITDAIETPALDQSVYDAYAEFGWSQSKVDGYYEDFKTQAALFNDYRLYYRNRLLCTGWFDKDIYELSRLTTRTAFDLFKATDYQSYDNAELFYDFGPKWYLQVAEDGSVTVPVNQETMPPMTFAYDYVFFVGGYDLETNHAFKTHEKGFPVEISADRKTIIIKACDVDGKPHYMNAIAGWNQYDAAITEPVVSEIKLTRGWTETKSSDTRSAGRTYVEKVNIEDEECERIVWKSMTKFPERENIRFEEAEPCIITMEMIEESLEKYASKYQRR
ncbi:MAG: hypothetical protein IJ504_07875 [Bacteroidales bacterium]|nr:hypothetical protein [Bacteroidales bacterium]